METEKVLNSLNTDIIPLLKSIEPIPDEKNPKLYPIKNIYDLLKKLYLTSNEINDMSKYYDLFEDISIRIKEKGYYISPEEKKIDEKALQSIINRFKKEKELIKPPVKVEPDSEPQPVTQINYIPDYLELFNKLSWAGINFGEKETLLLNNSLRNLAIAQPNGNVTFFGKIYGTKKDYYIAEATEVDPPENFNYDADMEKRKEDGVNKNVFFVTNDLCEKWVELPDVKPLQIVAARKIKYVFTGDLENRIVTNPYFYGQEKHYLRCQIARICHSSKLVPSVNHYVVEDPESPFKPLTPAEKLIPFKPEQICDLQNWIHLNPGILKCGRVSHMLDEPPEGVDPDEFKKKEMDKDPFDKRIKPVVEDEKISIGGVKSKKYIPWKLNQVYESNIYINPYVKLLDEKEPDFDPAEQKDNKANYLVVSVKSLRWPGAMNFYVGKETYFFYFGNGNKYLETTSEVYHHVYKSFPKIPDEAPEREDQPEPHCLPKAPQPEEEKREENPQEAPKEEEEN